MAGNHRARRRHLVPAVAAASIALCAGAATAIALAPGGDSAGDPFFPDQGNGGYDVGHYSLELDYKPGNGKLDATATIAATATQELSAFNLDYRGPTVRSVTVDGQPAAFGRAGQELTVTPAAAIAAGAGFEVVVAYRGRPQPLRDPDGSVSGWIPTDDGAFVAGEPQGSPTWFPCNDHPTDKATFDFAITVPRRVEAIANGALVERRRHGRRVTWRWAAEQPMAALSGDRRPSASSGSSASASTGSSRWSRSTRARRGRRSSRCGGSSGSRRFFSKLFGPYPFGADRGDRRPRAGGRLRARDPDPPDLLHRPRRRSRSPTRSPTSGSATRSASSAGRTSGSTRASRPGRSGAGTRSSAAGRPRRCSRSSSGLRRAAPTSGTRRRGDPGRPRAAVQRVGLRPRRDGARGAAPADRRADLSRHPARLGRRARLRQRARSTSSSRSPRRSRARTSTRCSSATCSSPASPEDVSRRPGRARA